MTAELLFSVIVPLEYHRGQWERCWRGWQEQTLPKSQYEMILVVPPNFPEQEKLPALLGPQDRLEYSSEHHDVGLCAIGAARARGKFLFFTESHCWPESNVLEKCLQTFAAHPEWAAFSCQSKRVTHNRISDAEAAMYEADIEYGLKVHPWRKVLDQCFVKASVARAWARALFAWPWVDGDERYRRFCRLWNVTGDLARQRALFQRKPPAEQHDRTATPLVFEYRPGVGPSRGLVGFHARETFDGQPFRWSSPLALVRVAVPPGDYEVRLDTKGIRDCHRPGLVEFYLNGRRMPCTGARMAGQITFCADHTMFRVGAPQYLVLASGRFRVGPAERRVLGVPVFAITFVPLERKATVSEICGSESNRRFRF